MYFCELTHSRLSSSDSKAKVMPIHTTESLSLQTVKSSDKSRLLTLITLFRQLLVGKRYSCKAWLTFNVDYIFVLSLAFSLEDIDDRNPKKEVSYLLLRPIDCIMESLSVVIKRCYQLWTNCKANGFLRTRLGHNKLPYHSRQEGNLFCCTVLGI